jgi:beta-glucosidase
MVALKKLPRQSILALLYCAALTPVLPASSAAPGIAHVSLWPVAHSAGLVDPVTERQVSELMLRMSLAEKVGQTIQADISAITPEDLRHYPLGAVLAGGESAPVVLLRRG